MIVNLIFIFITFAYFKYKTKEGEYRAMVYPWLIDKSDIFIEGRMDDSTNNMNGGFSEGQIRLSKKSYNKGNYDGKDIMLTIFKIPIQDPQIIDKIFEELDDIYNIHQRNLNVFIAAFYHENSIGIVTHFYKKSTLYELLINEMNVINDMILISLINDLINGLYYIHTSKIKFHGNLSSKNCFVDNRWILKIKEFGLLTLIEDNRYNENDCMYLTEGVCENCRNYLWKSPEFLQNIVNPMYNEQMSDIFSFGVILQECYTNRGPWEQQDSNICHIIEKIKYSYPKFLSDFVKDHDWSDYKLFGIMMKSLDQYPKNRPTIQNIKKVMKNIMRENSIKPNVIDNIITIMSYYTKNLEKEVQNKTLQLQNEKKQTDLLVERILPKNIADQLATGSQVDAEVYEMDIYLLTTGSALAWELSLLGCVSILYITRKSLHFNLTDIGPTPLTFSSILMRYFFYIQKQLMRPSDFFWSRDVRFNRKI
ncbi:hypothetical protein HZS_7124 [Henneguya salminicola]|nr:hypothetical protein HZS_7124 [Henneguya salminicola]